MPNFISTDVLKAYLRQTTLVEMVIRSAEFTEALARDFTALGGAPEDADALFGSFGLPTLLSHSPVSQIAAWEYVLQVLRSANRAKYEAIHKGTPFYFMGVASYLTGDFERALFYMDCAVSEDLRLHGARWSQVPSGLFLRLDDIPDAQFAKPLVRQTREFFESWCKKVGVEGGTGLTIESYRVKFVDHAMSAEAPLRSAVTAFLSFLLEARARLIQLELAPAAEGTGEPFFLHLFKGGLLFETLLKLSTLGKSVSKAKPKCMLNDLLSDNTLRTALGFPGGITGFGASTFDDVLTAVLADATSARPFVERAVRATWGIRNSTGHNLAWPHRPSEAEYAQCFLLILAALCLALDRLYPG